MHAACHLHLQVNPRQMRVQSGRSRCGFVVRPLEHGRLLVSAPFGDDVRLTLMTPSQVVEEGAPFSRAAGDSSGLRTDCHAASTPPLRPNGPARHKTAIAETKQQSAPVGDLRGSGGSPGKPIWGAAGEGRARGLGWGGGRHIFPSSSVAMFCRR